MDFERARNTEQIAQRRKSIIKATLALFEEVGFDNARLADIGTRAGVSKASVYRYFESKEAIYLELLERETELWVRALEGELALLRGSGSLDNVAHIMAQSLDERPRLCSLAAKLSSVLEKNVSVDAIRSFKRSNMALTVRLVNAMHAALPALSVQGAQRLISIIVTFQNGLYPTAHPPATTEAVLAEPEFTSYRGTYYDAMFDASRLLLIALTSESSASVDADFALRRPLKPSR